MKVKMKKLDFNDGRIELRLTPEKEFEEDFFDCFFGKDRFGNQHKVKIVKDECSYNSLDGVILVLEQDIRPRKK